ncbi:MAG: type transport system permease protein [Actinomycetota bacterium]|jgi:ABC-2 type transport system permease protein|nr:type transport system permease protein [Actinomycetota bacterium]
MSDIAIAARQVKFEQKSFWRNPAAAVFTFAFPLMFLLIFGSLNSGQNIDTRGGISFVTFFVPGIAAFGLISACYTNIAMKMAISRDLGILKRIKGTPVPTWSYLAGQIGSSIVTTIEIITLTLGVGVLVYGVDFRWDTLPGLLLTVALGAACFCALGLAISGVCPNGDAAPAIVNFSVFPLIFVSGIFFPLDGAPSWLLSVAKLFPVQHLANGLQYAFDPRTAAPGVNGGDLAVLAVWIVIGSVLALRLFKWENER